MYLFWEYLETFNFAFQRLFNILWCLHIKHLPVSKTLKSFVDVLFLLLAMVRIFTCGNYKNSKQFTVWPKVSHLHMIYWWITCVSVSSTSSINAFLSCSGTEIAHPFLAQCYMTFLNSWITQDSYSVTGLFSLPWSLGGYYWGCHLLPHSVHAPFNPKGENSFLLLAPGSVILTGNRFVFT
jgi:hypothetical protein